MNYTININIKEVISNLPKDEQLELINYIMHEEFNKKERRKFMKTLLEDLIDTESEFDKRVDVLADLSTIMKVLC